MYANDLVVFDWLADMIISICGSNNNKQWAAPHYHIGWFWREQKKQKNKKQIAVHDGEQGKEMYSRTWKTEAPLLNTKSRPLRINICAYS